MGSPTWFLVLLRRPVPASVPRCSWLRHVSDCVQAVEGSRWSSAGADGFDAGLASSQSERTERAPSGRGACEAVRRAPSCRKRSTGNMFDECLRSRGRLARSSFVLQSADDFRTCCALGLPLSSVGSTQAYTRPQSDTTSVGRVTGSGRLFTLLVSRRDSSLASMTTSSSTWALGRPTLLHEPQPLPTSSRSRSLFVVHEPCVERS